MPFDEFRNDLFYWVEQLDHDYREEGGKRIHTTPCRRCAITRHLHHLLQQLKLRNDELVHSIGKAAPDPPAKS